MNNNIDIILTTSGDDKVSNKVMNKTELGGVCGTYTGAVRDDYEYWRMCGESDTSGKLFLIDYNGDDGDMNNCDINGDNGDNNNDNSNNNNKVHENFGIENNNDDNDIINNGGKFNSISNTNKKSESPSNNNDNNPRKTIQLFFDDNIERDRLHIVDVRDLRTLIPVPFKKVNNIFVKKVEPYFAIIDDNYFINEALIMINAQIKL
jgi:hypothetical protein